MEGDGSEDEPGFRIPGLPLMLNSTYLTCSNASPTDCFIMVRIMTLD
jgi:hypothetical protein